MEQEKRKRGRPNIYNFMMGNLDKLTTYIQSGYNIKDACKAVGVNYETFRRYKEKYPEIAERIQNARENLTIEIENTFYMILLGKAKTTKTTYKYIYDENGNEQIIEKNVTEDTLKPCTADFVFALTNLTANRDKGVVWRNRQDESDNSIMESIKNSKEVLDKITGALLENEKDSSEQQLLKDNKDNQENG